MLQMYILMLVSMESVWEHFWSLTDPENDQNYHYIFHIPLQWDFNTNAHLLTFFNFPVSGRPQNLARETL